MVLSGIRPSFPSLSRSTGQITHVLLTRSPLEHPHQKVRAFPFDLHVLSTPPAFVLSQDQTLQKNKQKTITGKKQRNQQNNNKQQTLLMLMFAFMFMFIYKQSLLHQMTHYRVLKQHHHPQPNTQKAQGRKQRPHKYTNPTTKPQTTTSQQQKLTVVDHSEDLITFIVIRESTRATPGLPSKPLVNHCSYCSESRTRTRIK